MSTTRGLISFKKEAVLRDYLYDLIKSAIDTKNPHPINERGLGDLFEFMKYLNQDPLCQFEVYKEFAIPHYGICDVVVVNNHFVLRPDNSSEPIFDRYTCVYAIEAKNTPVEAKHYNQICRYARGLMDSTSFDIVRTCIIGNGLKDAHFLCDLMDGAKNDYDLIHLPVTYECSYGLSGVQFDLQGGWNLSAVKCLDEYHDVCDKHYTSKGVLKTLSDEEKQNAIKTITQ